MSELIFSHDIDHISSYEHLDDLIIPKFLVRSCIERAKGVIGSKEFYIKLMEIVKGHWNFVRDLSDFNVSHGIKSTFFFATANGIGLAYNAKSAKPLVDYVLNAGHHVGIHGIARDNVQHIKNEIKDFERIYGHPCRGMRLHYLYPNQTILPVMAKAGCLYDSSLRGEGTTRIVNGMVHFPVHIMDSDVFSKGKRYQSANVFQAVADTKDKILRLQDVQVDYISLLFHDRYFSDAHCAWRDWYITMVDWIVSQKIPTTTYEDAVAKIKGSIN